MRNEVADVRAAFNVLHVGGTYGPVLSPRRYGIGVMALLFIMANPGVKKEFQRNRALENPNR